MRIASKMLRDKIWKINKSIKKMIRKIASKRMTKIRLKNKITKVILKKKPRKW